MHKEAGVNRDTALRLNVTEVVSPQVNACIMTLLTITQWCPLLSDLWPSEQGLDMNANPVLKVSHAGDRVVRLKGAISQALPAK